MSKSALVCTSLSTAEIEQYSQQWLLNSRYEQLSSTTIETRKVFIRNLIWFLHHRRYQQCGTLELREFIHYLRTGHEEPGGRWGKPQYNKPLRPISVKDYYICIRTFFDWAVKEELLAANPINKIDRPQVREEVKQPLSHDETEALLRAARLSNKPKRNVAIIYLLADTGVRCSEIANLRVSDINLKNLTFEVVGKGNKRREVVIGVNAAQALSSYIRKAKLSHDAPLFPSRFGGNIPISRSGMLHLIKRLARVAGVKANVHKLRRTFATASLESGADVAFIKEMLGHTTLKQTLKYLSVSQSHMKKTHAQHSPGNRLKLR